MLIAPATEHKGTSGSKIASDVTIVAYVLITIIAMAYIDHKANKAKPDLVTERRMSR